MNEESKEVKVDYKNPCVLPPELNIYQRINWVREQIGYVQEDAKVGYGNNTYSAVSHDAVTANLRPFLIKGGIVVRQTLLTAAVVDSGSTTKSGITIIRYEAMYQMTFINVDNNADFFSVDIEAHALDSGDKSPGKACSYSMKYALLKTFSIETGEDEESRIEQKAQVEMDAEKEAWRLQKVNTAKAELMDSIVVIKDGIKESLPDIDKKSHQATFGNEAAIYAAIEAWGELSTDEQKSLWVAPSKGGPFSTDERYVMKCDRWAQIRKGE